MQTFENGQKQKFYNPIWQNKMHIKYLGQLLQEIQPEYFKSIIVFSERCKLKKIEIYSPDVKVIKRNNLIEAIEMFINKSKPIFSKKQIKDIYNSLKPYTHVSDAIKNNHINNIKEFKNH